MNPLPQTGYLDDGDNDSKVKEFIAKYADDIRTNRNRKYKLERRDLNLILPKLSMETEVDLINTMKVNVQLFSY